MASPEPLAVMLTLMPWLFSKVTAIMLHHAAWAEQMMLTSRFWAWTLVAIKASNGRILNAFIGILLEIIPIWCGLLKPTNRVKTPMGDPLNGSITPTQ